jgi:hypothetical protein
MRESRDESSALAGSFPLAGLVTTLVSALAPDIVLPRICFILGVANLSGLFVQGSWLYCLFLLFFCLFLFLLGMRKQGY